MSNTNKPPGRFLFRRDFRRSKARNRSPSPQKLDRFLRKRVDSFRAIHLGPTQYDDDEQRYKAQDAIAVDDLKRILEAHDGDDATELKVSSSSWETVFDQIAEAKRHHEQKTDYNSKAQVGLELTSSYINLVPDEYGLGVLKGGLALIFNTIKTRGENRQRILDAFETMPDTIITINIAHACLQPEPQDTELQMEFLSILVKDIPALIKILLGEEPWYRRIVDALLLEIPKTSTIDDILSRWDRQLARLKEHVETLKIQLQKKFSTQLDRIEEKMDTKNSSIIEIFNKHTTLQQSCMNQLQDDFARCAGDVARNMDDKYAELATMFLNCIQSRKEDHEREEWLRQELRQERDRRDHDRETFDQERKHYIRKLGNAQARREQLEQEWSQPSHQVITPIQLLGVLSVSLDDSWKDLDFVSSYSERFDASLRGQAQWLVQMAEFQDWLHQDRSSVLLADGCMEADFVSPMSGFCCGLISYLINDLESAVAFFFAGLHTRKTLSGPTAIMRSLIAQLLLNSELPKPNLEFVSEAILQNCARGHCRTLCDVFVYLVEQVPPQMQVFCIIDGITWYEQSPWLDDMRYVATMFEHLANRAPSGHSGLVKLLMTCPTRSIAIVDLTMKPGSVWSHVVLANGDVHPGMAPQFIEY